LSCALLNWVQSGDPEGGVGGLRDAQELLIVEKRSIKPECLLQIQPDIRAWIDQKYVSYEDVPYMTSFPLNPIEHLNGDISTLVTQQYSCRSLSFAFFLPFNFFIFLTMPGKMCAEL
jgi:hypothetical protein